ncbi:hypothetical protein H0H93_000378, partial [Arthromyces matolae]
AANFFRTLDLSSMENGQRSDIEIECRQVRKASFFGMWDADPDIPNLNVNNKIYINFEDEGAAYGYEIKNNHPSQSFYAAVFLFDVYDLKIVRYDLPTGQLSPIDPSTPSLPASQSLRIGYGDSCVPPRMYGCPMGQDTDLSFLKVFLSSKPHKFSGIAQETPFSKVIYRKDYKSRGDSGPVHVDVEAFENTITIPVIQGPPDWLRDHG